MVKVSVIIPTFNNEDEISECIDSIFNQTYKDFEVIVVDDCSSDFTYELVKQLYMNRTNFKLLKNTENMKAAYTRNKAIKEAKGEYIAIQDADDYSHKERLQTQIEFLDKNPDVGFVGSNAYSFDNKGIWKKTNLIKSPTFKDVQLQSTPYVHGSITFRKSVLSMVGNYRVTKDTERGQDGDLIYRIYEKGNKGYNLGQVLYYYRETLETVRKRNFKNRYSAVKVSLQRTPWKTLSINRKIRLIRTLLIGLIPSRIWYKIMKIRAKNTLK